MIDDLALTELCMICHIHPYKYCCPRCSSRTCSLSCNKRHKQWASCNGIRDPTAYLKRSELTTPKGIDHDYNYLTSIERQLDNAQRDADARGILLYNGQQDRLRGKVHQPAKGEVPLQKAIKQCRIVVDRAPKGISRHKQNETHWDRRAKCIVWTVEWVHRNGGREIGRCLETEPLDVAYTKLVDSKTTQSIPGAGSSGNPPKKKRKPNKAKSKCAIVTPITPPMDLLTSQTTSPSASAPQECHEVPTADVPTPLPDLQYVATTMPDVEGEKPILPSAKTEQPHDPHVHFYLLLPSTPTCYRVLIPLAPSDTLSSALAERLVLEFPTIYALKQPPDKLPTGFMNEEDYLRSVSTKGHVDRHLDALLSEGRGWGRDDLDRDGRQDVDPGALQDVLKRDLVSVVDAV